MNKIKDKLLWDYLDGKLEAKVMGKVNRLIEMDKTVEERFKRIRVLNELIEENLSRHITPAPEDIAEGIRTKWHRAREVTGTVSKVNDRIIYVFLGVASALIAFGSTAFRGVFKYAYVDYPGIKSMDPVYVYLMLVSVILIILAVMVFDLMMFRKN